MCCNFLDSSPRGISKPSYRFIRGAEFQGCGQEPSSSLYFEIFKGRAEDLGLEGDKEGEEEVVAAEVEVSLEVLVGLTDGVKCGLTSFI